MKGQISHKFLRVAQVVATIAVVAVTLIFWKEFRGLTVEELVAASPKQIILSACLILVYYVLKSFIVIVPVLVVQIAAGLLFPVPLAILINLLGLVITLSISFWLGRFTGKNYVDKLIKRYPKSAIVQTLPQKNEFFFCFLIHSLCLFPMNMIGMFVGSLDISYRNYFFGAFLGSLVRVISVTVVGSSATEPSSPAFIISLLVTLLVSLASIVAYKVRAKKSSATDSSAEDSSVSK